MFFHPKALGTGCAVLLLLWSRAGLAQEADAATRAQRDAANPLRMIIEAGKLKVRQKPGEGETEPVAKAVPTRTVASRAAPPVGTAIASAPQTARVTAGEPFGAATIAPIATAQASPGTGTAGAGAKVEDVSRTAAPDNEAMPLRGPLSAGEPVPVAPTTEAAPPTAGAAISTRVELPGASASEAVPPVAPEAALPATRPPAGGAESAITEPAQAGGEPVQRIALAPIALHGATPAAPARAALELVDYVEPVLNERVRRRLRADGEVVVEFMVQVDGTVAATAVRSASDRVLEPVALDAVRQWRYRPIAAAQPHAVQLVFKLKD